MSDQQRLRPACAYAQSDQSLCWLLEYSMSVKLLTEHDLEFISLKGGCTGSSESTLVKVLHCWKSCVTAHIALTVDILQVEVDRLQTKLQFSEEEKRELGNRCRDLEGQIRGASPSKVYSVKSYPFDKPVKF